MVRTGHAAPDDQGADGQEGRPLRYRVSIFSDRIEWTYPKLFLGPRREQLPFDKIRNVRIRSILGPEVVIKSDNGQFSIVTSSTNATSSYNTLTAALRAHRGNEKTPGQ